VSRVHDDGARTIFERGEAQVAKLVGDELDTPEVEGF
jgi:hypothetical protein